MCCMLVIFALTYFFMFPNGYSIIDSFIIVQDPSFEFERRRDVPVKYNRELWSKTGKWWAGAVRDELGRDHAVGYVLSVDSGTQRNEEEDG